MKRIPTAIAPLNLDLGPTKNIISIDASGVVAGSYTNANITVNSFGLVTAASTGGTGLGQYKRSRFVGLKSGTAGTIPYDATIPQNTEGTEFTELAVTITPTSAANTLRGLITLPTVTCTNSDTLIIAVFRDTTANAIAAAFTAPAAATFANPMVIPYEVTAGSTAATTFKVRYGSNAGHAIRFNGEGTTDLGGVIECRHEVWEYS